MVEKGLARLLNSVGQDKSYKWWLLIAFEAWNLDKIKNDRLNDNDVAKVLLNLDFRIAMVTGKKFYPCFNLQM